MVLALDKKSKKNQKKVLWITKKRLDLQPVSVINFRMDKGGITDRV